jgi:hypothetical protein
MAEWPRREDKPAARPTSIALLPLTVGRHHLVLEVARVIELFPEPVFRDVAGAERPVVRADLYRLLGTTGFSAFETILARADGRSGRGPGPCVAFSVDSAERLVSVPLEAIAPLPPILEEQLEVDFLVGIVTLPTHMAFLLDPARLANAARAATTPAEL